MPPEPNPVPPQYVAYPRGQVRVGDPEKLRALADGYFALNWVFFGNVVLWFGSRAIPFISNDPTTALGLFGVWFLVIGLYVGFATYPQNKKIGYGCDWTPGWPIVASVLMALNAVLCCGIIGYVVMQQIAYQAMKKKFGVRARFGGLRKTDIEQAISEMRMAPPPPMP
ncbi:MAG TPA: hypothetical protein VHE55_00175 [Fimbriimonadaceae bacterium]|nr:hypothetical protein [Fimbriimonadaceae bacterium]